MGKKLPVPGVIGTVIKKALSLPLLWLAALMMLIAGQTGFSYITALIDRLFPALAENDAWITASLYLDFLGIWAVVLLMLVLIPKNRPILGALGTRARGNTWKRLGLGLAIGFGTNALCAVIALLRGDIHLYFDSFRPVSFVLIFIAVFIQSSAEELICRGFLYQRLMRAYRSPVAAILGNALFFAALHLLNPGVSALAIVNIVLCGLEFSLIVYYLDSFWCAAAIHAAWNFTQNIIFGLPNSGNVMPYAVFKLEAGSAVKSFAYDPAFGIEGTALTCAVELAVCVCVILWGRKHGAKPTDIWAVEA